MSAPSSEQEGREIASEIERTPRIRAVTDRALRVIDELASAHPSDEKARTRRIGLECLLASLGQGLGPGQDITEAEFSEWMEKLA